MQKYRGIFIYWLLAVVLGCGILAFSCLRAKAAEEDNAGYFTHNHADACYQDETYQCMGVHPEIWPRWPEEKKGHCPTCNEQVTLLYYCDHLYCSEANARWQENGEVICSVCGTLCSTWGTPTPYHTLTRKKLVCGFAEGEHTAEVRVTADTGWTNTGVLLTATCNLLKGDLTNCATSLSWQGGTMYVEENGTYTVEAVNGKGQKTTASYTVQCIDKTPPVIESVEGNTDSMTRNDITVTVQAFDGESGLAETAFSSDGGTTWMSSASFTVCEGAPVTLVVRDKAGNTASCSVARSAFPYPPEPEPVPPTPVNPDTGSETAQTPSSSTSQMSNDTVETPMKTSDVRDKEDAERKKEKKPEQDGEMSQSKSGTEQKEGQKVQKGQKVSGIMQEQYFNGKNSGQDTEASKGIVEEEVSEQFTVLRMRESDTGTDKSTDKSSMRTAGGDGTDAGDAAEGVMGKETQKAQSVAEMLKNAVTGQMLIRAVGGLLIIIGVLLWLRLLWMQSAVLYCYNGGEEYRRLAILLLRRKREEFELYLPDSVLETTGMPRYRLLVREGLVKRHGSMDLVVRSEAHKLRHPLEECVDFVL